MSKFRRNIYVCVRNNIGNFLFVLLYFIVIISALLTIDYLDYLRKFSSYENKPYNKDSVQFVLKSDEEYIDFKFLQNNNKLNNCVLLEYESKDGFYEIIYADLGKEYFEEVSEGKIDFNSKEDRLFVGIDVDRRKNEIIEINGKQFKIDGKLKRHISSVVNEGMFYSSCNLEKIRSNNLLVLASSDKNNVKKAYEYLKSNLSDRNVQLIKIKTEEAELRDYIDYVDSLKKIIIMFCFFFVFVFILIFRLWKYVNRKYVFVNEVLGNNDVKVELIFRYVCILFISIVMAVITFKLYFS